MRRPNILILYTDQQRWDAVGANGNPHIITPNLDALAASGTTFTHHFVQHPLCMPSRVSMLTGQCPATLGIPWMGVSVPEDTRTLPRLLNGYHTANIGKLHFLPHANRDHREPHPDYGFDHLEISDEPGVYEDAYRAWARLRKPHQMDALSVGLPPTTATWQAMMGIDDAIHHRVTGERDDYAEVVPFPGDDDMTHTAFVAEQTIEYIRRQANGTQPFLCIAGFYSPHPPLVVPQTFLDMYDPATLPLPDYPSEIDEARRDDLRFSDDHLRAVKHGYYAMITEVDHHIGRVLKALNDTELADETVVVFTSDHGEWLGDHLRYAKGYPPDDSVTRVPLIWHVPGGTTSQVRTEIVESVDIVPTLLDLAGFQVPPHLQGESLRPALFSRELDTDGDALTEGDGWKSLRTDTYRYLTHADGHERLYHLPTDPGEYHDVAEALSHVEALHDLRHRLLARIIKNERPLNRTWSY